MAKKPSKKLDQKEVSTILEKVADVAENIVDAFHHEKKKELQEKKISQHPKFDKFKGENK